ncbi:MAG: ATP-binding cassette domain-containing protein, partial [Candidatus Gracilibacteria bacterium]|nr:ATP-binding cassette domain-containing protein [Candidatus Gracilibacteria bacterium]
MIKIIQLKNISFSYDEKSPIFSLVNTEIYKGDFIGIFGENGAGKTTLVKILLGILKQNSGEINYFDEKQNKVSKNKFNIEYISQKAQ